MTHPIRVLHVDDEPGLTELVASFLERHNDRFDVHSETSPDDGLATLASTDIDCVVSDYEMPGKTGLDFLEDIREHHLTHPFILYTAKGSEEIASKAISNGVTDYIQKERCVDHYEVLANAIENTVSQYRAEQRAATMERRYKALFDQSEAAIAWIAFEGETPIIRDVNPAFRTLFCGADQAVVGTDLDEVVVTEKQSTKARALSQKIRAGQSIVGEFTRETVDGSRRMQVQVIPVAAPDNQPILNAFVMYFNVDQQRLEQ